MMLGAVILWTGTQWLWLVVHQGLALTTRRFPPPRSVEQQKACFVVRDHNGQALAYIYYEDEPGRAAKAPTAWRCSP
jgi:hypothetical protein